MGVVDAADGTDRLFIFTLPGKIWVWDGEKVLPEPFLDIADRVSCCSGELGLVPPLARRLRDQGISCEIVYLDAEHETLLKRFSETRRRHPLSNGAHGLDEALRLEREMMAPLRSSADLQLDTSHTNVHQLRDLIRGRLGDAEAEEVSLMFQSFGFKHGVPRNADPEINRLDNVYLYDLDDMSGVADASAEERRREAVHAEAIVSEEQQRFEGWLAALRAVPTIRHLVERAEAVRTGELDRALTVRAQGFSKSAREKIEKAGGWVRVVAFVD